MVINSAKIENKKNENLERIKGYIEKEIVFERKSNIIKEQNRLETYFNIGKEITEAIGKRSKYGSGLLKEYSKELTRLYGKGYDYSNLRRMRQLYLTFEKCGSVSHKLSWSHYYVILPLKNESERNYYINLCIKNRLTVRQLKSEIRSKSYERLISPNKDKIELINEDNDINIIKYKKDNNILVTSYKLEEKTLITN